jgi:hypothetical protein
MTALVLGFFAISWFGWGQAAASGAFSAALAVGSLAAAVAAVLGAIQAFRSSSSESALNDRDPWRRFGIVVGIEFAVAGLGAGVLGATGAADYIPVWICAVVGLHFFPLASVFGDPVLPWLGAAVTTVAGVALLAGMFAGVPSSSVTGAGTGLALLTFAILALTGPPRLRLSPR